MVYLIFYVYKLLQKVEFNNLLKYYIPDRALSWKNISVLTRC